MRISKSSYMAGVQCLKRLYWHVHHPELAAEMEAADEAIIAQGREVGLLARQMFPKGVESVVTLPYPLSADSLSCCAFKRIQYLDTESREASWSCPLSPSSSPR